MADLPARVALAQLLLPLAAPDQFAAFNDAASRREVSGLVVLGAPTEAELADLAEVDDAGVALLWSSDEEGGAVQRLAHLLGPVPSATELARLPLDEVRDRFEDYGVGLAALGFDVVFAPVVDVGGGPGIESRSFSDDPEVVVDYASAVIEGYQAATLVPVVKHFPGHGRASADSHLGFSTTPPLQELRQSDLVPFVELMAPAVPIMVGHLLVPGLAEDLPTSLAPEAIDGLLRSELGFDGIVITDALNMSAVSQRWDNAESVRLALVAGADLAIIDDPGAAAPVLDHLEAAIADESLSREQVDDSVERVLALKGVDPCQM